MSLRWRREKRLGGVLDALPPWPVRATGLSWTITSWSCAQLLLVRCTHIRNVPVPHHLGLIPERIARERVGPCSSSPGGCLGTWYRGAASSSDAWLLRRQPLMFVGRVLVVGTMEQLARLARSVAGPRGCDFRGSRPRSPSFFSSGCDARASRPNRRDSFAAKSSRYAWPCLSTSQTGKRRRHRPRRDHRGRIMGSSISLTCWVLIPLRELLTLDLKCS